MGTRVQNDTLEESPESSLCKQGHSLLYQKGLKPSDFDLIVLKGEGGGVGQSFRYGESDRREEL